MKDIVLDIVNTFPDNRKLVATTTPASTVLFKTRPTPAIQSDRATKFHTFVAKLLYLAKRARPDIALAVEFLSTRVQHPDEDDWNKLVRCIKYLNATSQLTLNLSSDSVPISKWWVDASYATHPNCHSHMGSVLSFGKGALSSHSTNQKLVTRSSTEAEVVAVNDMSSHILWTKQFLSSQGYGSMGTVVYQDNKSAVFLETNGQWSVGKRSKHMAVRYFFIRDRVDNGDLGIEWCTTTDMLADFFTKPLQGDLFLKFRKLIMNTAD